MADQMLLFLQQIPPVTRVYTLACVATTIATVWRLVTTFVYFGPLSLNWIFQMFFLVRYTQTLEESFFRGKTADMVYMLLFGATSLLIVSPLFTFSDQLLFLGSSLTFMVVYVWARRNPAVRMGILGLLYFRAPHLPFVLLGLSVLLDHDPSADVLGIIVGYVYFYLEDVYAKPRPEGLGGPRVLGAPAWLKYLIHGPEQEEVVPPPGARPAGGFDWGAAPAPAPAQ